LWRDPLCWLAVALLLAVLAMPAAEPLFHAAFPALQRPVYARSSFALLTAAHAALVLGAGVVIGAVGIGLGILVTRRAGRDLAPLVDALTAVGQTFPPVAILALAVPILGYGVWPTVLALVAYGILPVVQNTVAGLRMVDPAAREAADGMGFGPLRRLLWIELPIAAPLIAAGLRTATVINVGTATIGSTIGADTLGAPIIEGLSGANPAYVIQGAVITALLALVLDGLLVRLSRRFSRA